MATDSFTERSSDAGEVKRRGRKRGKHNFEPGYKDQLFEDWMAFTREHRRCPKVEEVAELSARAFDKRRAALKLEDANHPHLSILEAPLDAVQVKNLVNNEKRRRSKLVSNYPHGIPASYDQGDDGMEGGMQEDDGGSWRAPEKPAKRKGISAEKAFAPSEKKQRHGFSMAESEADSHSTVAAALANMEAGHRPGGAGRAADKAAPSSSGQMPAAAPDPTDHIFSAALAACQQVLQSQKSSGNFDLQLLQESLKQALSSQLQHMSPQQQLLLWQSQQQQQTQLHQFALPQQQALQQAIAALVQQPALAQALLQLPGVQGSLPHQTLLACLAGAPGQQLQTSLAGLSLPGLSSSPMSTSLASALSGVASSQPQSQPAMQQQPSLSQIMQLMQLLQQKQQ